jgi:hypothetical protein
MIANPLILLKSCSYDLNPGDASYLLTDVEKNNLLNDLADDDYKYECPICLESFLNTELTVTIRNTKVQGNEGEQTYHARCHKQWWDERDGLNVKDPVMNVSLRHSDFFLYYGFNRELRGMFKKIMLLTYGFIHELEQQFKDIEIPDVVIQKIQKNLCVDELHDKLGKVVLH